MEKVAEFVQKIKSHQLTRFKKKTTSYKMRFRWKPEINHAEKQYRSTTDNNEEVSKTQDDLTKALI